MPTVSIIIPTKNRCDLLKECLESIQAQTFEDWEAIVCDDGSTDGTDLFVHGLCKVDPRIRWLSRKEEMPSGAPARRNDGIDAASGQYIMFLDDDDLLAEICLERRIDVLENKAELDFVVGQAKLFVDRAGDRMEHWNAFTDEDDLDRFIRCDAPWQTSGPLWRAEALHRVGPWDEHAVRWQDWEFHIRALCLGLNYERLMIADTFWRTERPGTIGSIGLKSKAMCEILDVCACLQCTLSKNLTVRTPRSIQMIEGYAIRVVIRSFEGGRTPDRFRNVICHARKLGYITLIQKWLLLNCAKYSNCRRPFSSIAWRLILHQTRAMKRVEGKNTRNSESVIDQTRKSA